MTASSGVGARGVSGRWLPLSIGRCFEKTAACGGGAVVLLRVLADGAAPFGYVRFRIARRIQRRDERADVDAYSPKEASEQSAPFVWQTSREERTTWGERF